MPRKTTITLVLFAALMAGLRFVPVFAWVHGPGPDSLASVFQLPKVERPKPEPVAAPKAPAVPTVVSMVNTAVANLPPGPRLEDPSGVMAVFYESLLRCESRSPDATVRVLHYGDSPTTGDLVTADVRKLLQERYGDAGPGFLLVDKPWAWYTHRGVDIKANGWVDEAASQGGRAKDRKHGLGGVSFRGNAGAETKLWFGGGAPRRIEVDYLAQPGGGEFAVEAAGAGTIETVSTEAESERSGFASIALPAGTKSIRIAVTRGSVRLFGVWGERGTPGVIYSSLGLNGAGAQTLLRFFEPSHWREQIRHRSPDLIVLNYGSNESEFPKYVDSVYAAELRELVDRVRVAAPKSSILVMSPMDRGVRQSGGEIITVPALERVVKVQQQVASEAGVAFFNTYEAMGGSGTMARWYNGKPRLVSADFLHPMPAGAEKVGALLDEALYAGYTLWKAEHAR